jgi:hypothetical protein
MSAVIDGDGKFVTKCAAQKLQHKTPPIPELLSRPRLARFHLLPLCVDKTWRKGYHVGKYLYIRWTQAKRLHTARLSLHLVGVRVRNQSFIVPSKTNISIEGLMGIRLDRKTSLQVAPDSAFQWPNVLVMVLHDYEDREYCKTRNSTAQPSFAGQWLPFGAPFDAGFEHLKTALSPHMPFRQTASGTRKMLTPERLWH